MTNERIKRMLTLLATLAAAAVFAAGCGDDDDGGGGGGGGLGETTQQSDGTDATPDNKEEVIDRCFEEADKLDGEAKERAREACEAAEKGELPETQSLPEGAKEKCLEAAEQVPDEEQREQAKAACALLE